MHMLCGDLHIYLNRAPLGGGLSNSPPPISEANEPILNPRPCRGMDAPREFFFAMPPEL